MKVFVRGGGLVVEAVTATPSQVLSTYTYNDSEGEVQTGTMTNRGTVNTSVAVGATYTGAAGYYSSIQVTGPSLTGNASAAEVLAGKTFYSSTGTRVTGTMTNRGAVSSSVAVDGTYTGAAGYYSNITVVGPKLNGNATAAQVLAGSTFYNTTGTQRTGTMVNRGALSTTLNNWDGAKTYANTDAGYYTSITVTVAHTVYWKTGTINGYFLNTGLTATGYYGISYSMGSNTSVKLFASGGYVWATKNTGSSGTATFIKIW